MPEAPDVIPHWPGAEVQLPSARIFVRRAPATSPGAQRAVFVHGLAGSGHNWTDLMAMLQDRLDGVAPELPGFGLSPPPESGSYSLLSHAAALIELIEQEGSTPVHLLGNSLGGTVATVVAATRPDLVRTLTLISPALPVRRATWSNIHLPVLAVPWVGGQLADRLSHAPIEVKMRTALALTWADPSRAPEARLAEATAEIQRRDGLEHASPALVQSLQSLMAAYVMPNRWPLWKLASRVQAPTLLVYGLKDRLVHPKSADRAARTFPDTRLVLIPDSGHVSQMEHPEIVAAAVRRLLDEQSLPPAAAPQ